MKKKLDLSFIVFLVIVIVGGIFLNKLAVQRKLITQENKALRQVLENQDHFISELENLYLQSLLPRKGNDEMKEKFCFLWTASVSDSLANKIFHEIVSQLSNLSHGRVCICFPAELPADFNTQLKLLDFEIKIYPDLHDQALFYVNKAGEVRAYFEITPYTLPLLKKYLKLVRVKYLSL